MGASPISHGRRQRQSALRAQAQQPGPQRGQAAPDHNQIRGVDVARLGACAKATRSLRKWPGGWCPEVFRERPDVQIDPLEAAIEADLEAVAEGTEVSESERKALVQVHQDVLPLLRQGLGACAFTHSCQQRLPLGIHVATVKSLLCVVVAFVSQSGPTC